MNAAPPLSPDALLINAQQAFLKVNNLADWEQVKAKYFGKNSVMAQLMTQLAPLPPDEKKRQGQALNLIKQQLEVACQTARLRIEEAQLAQRLATEAIDISLPPTGFSVGALHPITRTWQRLETIFGSMGFRVADGPEIETDWFNFTALNSPENHPARSMQDTFYLQETASDNKPYLLRTHTSPVQIRYATAHPPPLRIIAPGRTYRVDSDATHSPMFHQIEGLWIDREISFAHLKGIFLAFVQAFFAPQEVKVRFRPSYFPFTEPSAEIDILFTEGALKGRWLEIAGSGQVHPQVLHNMGLDPEEFQGIAFGSGLERLTMLRYGVDDLRLFYDNDLRFLSQFSA